MRWQSKQGEIPCFFYAIRREVRSEKERIV